MDAAEQRRVDVDQARRRLAAGDDEQTVERQLVAFGMPLAQAKEVVSEASRVERPVTRLRGALDLGAAVLLVGLGIFAFASLAHGPVRPGGGSVAPFVLIVVGSGLGIRGLYRVIFGR